MENITTLVDMSIYSLPQTNQGLEPACDAFCIAKYVQLIIFRQTGKIVNISQRWIYANCVRPGFTGLFTSDVMDFGKRIGFCTSDLINEDVTIPEMAYRVLEITQEMNDRAAQYKIGDYTSIPAEPELIWQALKDDLAVVASIPEGNFAQAAVLPPIQGVGLGLHAALIYGIAPVNQNDVMFLWDNWWGMQWGNNGYGTFLWSQFKLKIQQIYSIKNIIIMDNYTPSFEKSVNNTLNYEGGYTNDLKDPGGETNFGISKRAYPNEDIKNMTKDRATEIYHSDFWLKIHGDAMSPDLAMNVFDAAVNIGVFPAIKLVQEALGVGADGDIGPITLGAMAKATTANLETFASLRAEYYTSLAEYPTFGKGWISRTIGTLVNSLNA